MGGGGGGKLPRPDAGSPSPRPAAQGAAAAEQLSASLEEAARKAASGSATGVTAHRLLAVTRKNTEERRTAATAVASGNSIAATMRDVLGRDERKPCPPRGGTDPHKTLRSWLRLQEFWQARTEVHPDK